MNDLRNEDRAAPIAAPVRGPRTGEVVTGPPPTAGATPLFDGSDRDRTRTRRNGGARRRARPADGADRSDTDRGGAHGGERDRGAGARGRVIDRGDGFRDAREVVRGDDDDRLAGPAGHDGPEGDGDRSRRNGGTRQGEFTFDVTRQVRSMPRAAEPDDGGDPDHGDVDAPPGHGASRSPRSRGAGSRSGSADELAARVARSAHEGGGPPGAGQGTPRDATAPTSRPARRRGEVDPDARPDTEAGDDADDGDGTDKFPWHHQFADDDEPRELKANSPLLSRAFRYSVG